MYLRYFNFDREPFNITPDPDFLFLSKAHQEALASIVYGVEQRKGFIVVIGQIGVGKTTIIRSYLKQIDPSKVTAIYILNPMLSFGNLLKQIVRELRLQFNTKNTFEILSDLQNYLLHEFSQGRNVVLIIDEAQNMPLDTLENLRMLSNIETSKDKLVQIVFCAQPEFELTLNLQELAQLKQRVSVKTVISPLDPVSGVAYIRSRLDKAATVDSAPFTSGALKDIVRFAHGIPRVINILCDNCLVNTFGRGQKVVDSTAVRDVATELGLKKHFAYKLHVSAFAVLLISAAGLYFYKVQIKPEPSPVTSARPTQILTPGEPSASTKGKEYVSRVVQRGDTLVKLVTEVYGRADKGKMALVKRANPKITDENLIVEGLHLRFPLQNFGDFRASGTKER